MNLKSLAEIAFDAHECFSPEARKYKCKFSELAPMDKLIFERMAARVHCEILLRTHPEESFIAVPNLDI